MKEQIFANSCERSMRTLQPFCRGIMPVKLFFLKSSVCKNFFPINIYLYLQMVDTEDKHFGQNKLQNEQVIQSFNI